MPNSLARSLSFVAILGALASTPARAVPTAMLLSGSGNQRDVDWRTVETSKFRVYHDEKAAPVGRYALQALETAWPHLSAALGVRLPGDPVPKPLPPGHIVSKFDQIPVVLSTRADTGGFANPATQNIELQIASGSQASLFQHELVHRIMYERMDPWLGPAGRAFSLAMLPTWWIEGLAEYLTESMGRHETLGIARTLAMRGLYPTWGSLHNLYSSGGDYGRGYTTAGRFFGFLMKRSKEKSLVAIHNDFFWKTLLPPFMTASGMIINKYMGASGEDLYEAFKEDEAHHWRETLAGMPALGSAPATKALVRLSWIPDSHLFDDKLITSQLTRKPYSSSFLITDAKTGSLVRRPLSIEGSGFLEPDLGRSAFWTTRGQEFSNATAGSRLVYVTFEGALVDVTDASIRDQKEIRFASEANPAHVTQITSLGDGKAFVLSNTRGTFSLSLVDANAGTIQEKRKWEAPRIVKILPRRSKSDTRTCVTALVDSDLEQTSLEKVCIDGQATTLFPARKLYIRHGVEEADGTFTLLVAWNQCQGIVSVSGHDVRGGFPVPEWIDRLTPLGAGALGAWVFYGDGYDLYRFSTHDVHGKFEQWASGLPANSPWRRMGAWTPYEPPFIRIAAEQRELTLRKESLFATATKENSEPEKPQKFTFRKTAAPYQHKHWFTYPTVVPKYFGGWSLGLASVPLMDEMERYQIQLMGQYNFTTGKISGDLSYVNHRILDSFVLTGFSRERFNGFYYWVPANERGTAYRISPYPSGHRLDQGQTSYLRENGAEISIRKRFRPTSLSVNLGLRLSELSPSDPDEPVDQWTRARTYLVGAERGLIGSGSLSLGFDLFETAFYMEDPVKPGGTHLRWTTTAGISAETTHSLDEPRDFLEREQAPINFQRFSGRLTSVFAYEDHAVTLRGAMSGTTGAAPLLLREFYQPYQTYLLGSGMGLNQLNYELMSSGALFDRLLGVYAFRTAADWSFPIIKSLDKQILIFYFDTLRGEVVVGHGGVARTEDFKDIHTRSSASFAARATIDIKGFQLYPSLAYGRLLDGSGWSVFSELSFSQFF